VVINVCPAAMSKAPPARFWEILLKPEAFGEWTDAAFVSSDPPGTAVPGQVITLGGRALWHDWTFRIDVVDMDPHRRWIDLVAYFPFGITNHEHLTLTETKEGGTLVRLN
jgi:hypothetical protein